MSPSRAALPGDMNKTFMLSERTAGHMGHIADPVAAAIVKQCSDAFCEPIIDITNCTNPAGHTIRPVAGSELKRTLPN